MYPWSLRILVPQAGPQRPQNSKRIPGASAVTSHVSLPQGEFSYLQVPSPDCGFAGLVDPRPKKPKERRK